MEYLQRRVVIGASQESSKSSRHHSEDQRVRREDTVQLYLEVADSSTFIPEYSNLSFSHGWNLKPKRQKGVDLLFKGPIWIKMSSFDTRETINQIIRGTLSPFYDSQDLLIIDLLWLGSRSLIRSLWFIEGEGFVDHMKTGVYNGGKFEETVEQSPISSVQPFIFISRGMVPVLHLHDHLPSLRRE